MNKPLGNTKPRSGLIAALDLGTSKVSCLIARLNAGVAGGEVTARVVGIGHQKSHGLKSGSVIDLDAAEATIRATVEAAEAMVGENIQKVLVNLSCGKPKSKLIAHETDIGGREIEVRFDDWMFLQEDGVVLNRATVTKFGIELGTATIFFQKERPRMAPALGLQTDRRPAMAMQAPRE